MALRALARVNLAAIERNAARLRDRLEGDAELCAVVKAEASGHGALRTALAALAGGATSLAVATADEAAQLRAAGIKVRLLVMGALSAEELPVALGAGAEVVAWTERFVDALATHPDTPLPLGVHVKLDSGMGRLGTRDVREAVAVADAVQARAPRLALVGAMTHLATADGDLDFATEQLRVFEPFATELQRRAGRRLRVHAANSAATLRLRAAHFDMVRCGIALYGCDPMNVAPDPWDLEPALELSSYVAAVKRALPGDSAGYGRRFVAERETWIATLPIGYADGVRRALTNNCDVLIAGRRHPLIGTVSMDNITVDLGPDDPGARGIAVGTPAILVGRSGSERQTIEDLSNRIDTIAHEFLCGISRRVPRHYHRDGDPA